MCLSRRGVHPTLLVQSKYPASTIVFDMSLTYICSAFVGVVLSNVLVEKLSLRVRIGVGYVLSFVVLLFVASSDVAGHAFSPTASYRITLVSVAVVALGCTGTSTRRTVRFTMFFPRCFVVIGPLRLTR